MEKSLHFYRNNSANKKVLTCSPVLLRWSSGFVYSYLSTVNILYIFPRPPKELQTMAAWFRTYTKWIKYVSSELFDAIMLKVQTQHGHLKGSCIYRSKWGFLTEHMTVSMWYQVWQEKIGFQGVQICHILNKDQCQSLRSKLAQRSLIERLTVYLLQSSDLVSSGYDQVFVRSEWDGN